VLHLPSNGAGTLAQALETALTTLVGGHAAERAVRFGPPGLGDGCRPRSKGLFACSQHSAILGAVHCGAFTFLMTPTLVPQGEWAGAPYWGRRTGK
jgi:hypothetical protein